jgi:hypothetical protein
VLHHDCSTILMISSFSNAGYRTVRAPGRAASSTSALDQIRPITWSDDWNGELLDLIRVSPWCVPPSGALADAPSAPAIARTDRWDVLVVGVGVFGAWTAWTLQRRGNKVLLLDAWGAAHSRASSGGETRLIRTEYAAAPLYTRWAWRSLAEWQALSRRHEARSSTLSARSTFTPRAPL